MITIEDIYRKTNGGLDVIFYYYPQARECMSGKQKHFRIRNEDHTPSATLKEFKGVWKVTDFGGDGRALSPVDICMQEMNAGFSEAVHFLAKEFNVDGQNISADINKPDIRTRAAADEEPDGHFAFEVNDRFSDSELAVLGPKVSEKICEELGYMSLKQYSLTKEGKTTVIASTENYPVFMRKCRYVEGDGKTVSHFYKIYQPLNPDKAFRFFYKGEKPMQYINGLLELKNEYRLYNDRLRRDMINAGEISEDDEYPMQKIPEAFICSGERDALCIRALGYRPLWFNSETYRLTPPEYAEMAKYVEKIYNIPDIDATGVRKAVELSMQYYDIHVVWLPERLKEFRDRRGRPRKDFRDFCEIWPEKIRFQELLNMAMPFRFWEYRPGEKGGRRLEFITEYAIQFIYYNGFVWIEDKSSPDGKRFVHIRNNIVRDANMFEIRHFFREYVRSHHLSLDVRELINNSSRFNESLLEKVYRVEVDFCRHTPTSQFFFFGNAIWEAMPDGIINHPPGKAKQYVWESEIIPHNVRRLDPAFETERKPDGTFDIKVSALHGSLFFKYLINASRIYWREELESATVPEEKLKAYRETYKFAIDGPALSDEEIAEQKHHLVNKIFALGYLLHNYKTEHRALCVFAMDNKESSVEESNGGTGKSFCFKTPRMFQESVTLSGRNPKLTENNHLFENVTPNTRYILIDDSHQYTNFDFFFDKVTGEIDVNQKNVKSFTIPFHLAPKFCVTSNYVLRNIDASTARRILYAVFSDYYHQKTDSNDYRETRTIYDDFGKDLFWESYTEEEWNADINFLVECCRFYLSTLKDNIIVQPPMNRVRIRNLRAIMGETFLDWAQVYFSKESGNCDRLLPYSDVITEYKAQSGIYKISTQHFTKALKAYCDYESTILAYNPKTLQNAQERIIRKKDGKATAFLYVQRKPVIFESSEYAATAEDVPEDDGNAMAEVTTGMPF